VLGRQAFEIERSAGDTSSLSPYHAYPKPSFEDTTSDDETEYDSEYEDDVVAVVAENKKKSAPADIITATMTPTQTQSPMTTTTQIPMTPDRERYVGRNGRDYSAMFDYRASWAAAEQVKARRKSFSPHARVQS
jgi:hypothetical protein